MDHDSTPYSFLEEDIISFIQINATNFSVIQSHKDFFITYAEALVDFIITELKNHPQTNQVFEEGRGNYESLGKAITAWLVEILESSNPEKLWKRQYKIGIEHIRRGIPNRHMMGLATRIREFLLPVMINVLGVEEGVQLFLSFQRFLDSIVALTSSLVDEGQKRCLMNTTGFTEILINRLQSSVFNEIKKELESEA